MAVNDDYYNALGVSRTASRKEIQSAFRQLARKYHPDLNRNDAAAEARFKEISEAHEVLADPKKRAAYDRYGRDWQAGLQAEQNPAAQPRGAGGRRSRPVTVDPEHLRDLFGADWGSVFGFGGGQRQVEAEVTMDVALREVFDGGLRQATLPDGRTVEVKVPAGVREGTVLRVPGLRARVHILPDPRFTLDGKDLKTVVDVPLRTALKGGAVQVPTPKGGRVELKVPPQTQNGTRLRLRGLGVPGPGQEAGDLFAEVKVLLPLPLDDQTRGWVEAMPD